MNKIIPNLWFDRNAEEAVDLYLKLFSGAKKGKTTHYGREGYEFHQMPEGTVLTVDFELEGQPFVALNGGPAFQMNPSISFMLICQSEQEIDKVWNGLLEGAVVLMELNKYDWSPRYGWLQDRFGVSWQLYLADQPHAGQKIVPTLMFTKDLAGKAEEAVKLYTSIFENSAIEGILKYGPGEGDQQGHVKHSQFTIHNYTLAAMDSSGPHPFKFNEAVSIIVNCKTQAEVDKYWNALIADGGQESQCGWLKDKFGVSWQIIPERLYELLNQVDKAKAGRATEAMLRMKKIVIADLESAAR